MLLLLAVPVARAEDTDLSENLFPPELIMQNQQALGLSEEQKSYIKAEVRKTQTVLTELQWKLEDGVEKIAALLKADQMSEQTIIAQLDKVLGLEQDIKRTQMVLLIRLKNKLTPEQQTRLRELKTKAQAR
ncbi:MAG: hypothetical protein HYR56_14650 [Acidobacteria bacterium]|nr:hypothetical protein [Acidobacteriota bacterium]MBI3425781.1 hypothetical protein [Acidobacteriota bacterium]